MTTVHNKIDHFPLPGNETFSSLRPIFFFLHFCVPRNHTPLYSVWETVTHINRVFSALNLWRKFLRCRHVSVGELAGHVNRVRRSREAWLARVSYRRRASSRFSHCTESQLVERRPQSHRSEQRQTDDCVFTLVVADCRLKIASLTISVSTLVDTVIHRITSG